jgi:mannose-6-phosphate isomerase-like protein (cupin superfamily)
MNIDQIKTQLASEGFKHIYEWVDGPHTDYSSHEHQDKVTFYIVDGSIDFFMEHKTFHLAAGDRFDVPPKTQHTAKVGADGCKFIVGEMIEGDS